MNTTLHRSDDPLLQPFQLKHLTLKNRIMSTAHEPNYHEDGMPKDTYRAYHVEKAKGGIAMTMTAGSAVVSPDSPAAFGNLHAYKDEITGWMKKLTDECHEHGCAVMIQLTHLGRRTAWNTADWLPVLSASPVREPAHRAFPKQMEDWDMARIIKDYASAAQRMQAAGLDGIELECYGHLIDSFWSPATNHRNDDYGGTLANRMRFAMAVYQAIRDATGPEFLVGTRLVVDEDWDKGLSRADGLAIAKTLMASGNVDFLNVIRGHIEHDAPLADVIPVAGMASAPHLDFAGEVRAETKCPVFHAARIGDVATARHAIAEGRLDMAGMTRAHIADPHIVKKITEGREDEIRPCVGATYCLDRIYEGHGTLCIHNPSTGRELAMPHVIARTGGPARHIVIAGAGPAGLEAARVSAERGNKVTVLEAASEAGGQIRLAVRHPRRREITGIIGWRLARCERLGVDIRYNTFAGADDITGLDPDCVVIATGGLPDTSAIAEGAELAVTGWDILSGDVPAGEDILFYDDNGAHAGMTAAESLIDAGAILEIVTPERFFSPEMGGLSLVPYMKKFHTAGVTITPMMRVRALARQGNKIRAALSSTYTNADTATRLVDQVVVEYATRPLDELYFALKPASRNLGELDHQAFIKVQPQTINTNPGGRFQLFRIGDAVAARNIHAAIYDGLRLCRVL